MKSAFVKFGHGYETGDRGRCDAFDGFKILAKPLHQEGEGWKAAFGEKARESRIFNRQPNGNGGTCYGSHAIMLAENESRDLFILMHHGSGREVLEVSRFYDGGDLRAMIEALPEQLKYALLYTIWRTASNARKEASAETRHKWATAHLNGHIRKKRRNGGIFIEIMDQWEIDAKTKKTA